MAPGDTLGGDVEEFLGAVNDNPLFRVNDQRRAPA